MSRYRILESLGSGGMGEVFLATDTELGRRVAIKFLSAAAAQDDLALARLRREARAAAALDHPFICKIHDITEVDGRTGIVMEHVAGETLQAALERNQLTQERAIEIASEIAEALEEAHDKRLIHRDLKPANVMLTEQGRVKVMDFGLAKQVPDQEGTTSLAATQEMLTAGGAFIGTPAYMAPEQILGKPASTQSDVFSFGVILFELLTGRHPFLCGTLNETIAAILRDPPALPPNTSPVSDLAIFDKLLAKEPHRRCRTFREVRAELRQLRQAASSLTAAPRSAPKSPSTARRTPFVGREAERAEAHQLLERALSGQGGVLFLGGEPGVGKTRLAEEMLSEARRRGCLTLVGRCYELEGTPPFIPWVEIVERAASIVPHSALRATMGDAAPEVAKLVPELRRLFPDLPPPVELPPEQQQRYLFNAFLEFLGRGSRVSPQVLLIDDLHWADNSTLRLLLHVAQHVAELPLLIMGTYRDVDLDVQRPFAETLETLTRQRLALKLALGRLPETDIGEMLAALSGEEPPASLVTLIYAETEGNPFFTEEVFHHLSEEGRLFDHAGRWRTDLGVGELEVPEGVRLVIGRRVQRLSEEARRVLTTAAIVGRSFDVRLLEELGDAEGDTLLLALEEAEAAKLIVSVRSGREVRWEFAHGLIGQTLENSLSLMRRQRAHLRVAEAMERVHGSGLERHASDIAQHLYQAGVAADPEKTIRFLTLAGDQSLEAGAFDEALRQYGDALGIQEEEGQDRHKAAELRYKKGLALRSLLRGNEAVEEWELALTAFERLGDNEGIARTAHDMAEERSWQDTAAARAVAQRGLAGIGANDAAARCRMLALLARFGSLAGDPYGVGRDLLEEAEAIAAALDRPELAVECLAARTRFHWSFMQLPAAIDIGRRCSLMMREGGELYEVAELDWQVLASLHLCGRLREARDLGAELETRAERVGHAHAGWVARLMRTRQYLITTGDLAGSEAHAGRDLEWAEQNAPLWRPYDHFARGAVRFFAGDWAGAREDYEEAVRLDPPSFLDGHVPTMALVARAYAGDDVGDDLEHARSRAAALAEENLFGLWELLVAVVEGLALLGRRQEAADLYPLVIKGVEKGRGISWHFRLWQMVAGIAAACGRRWTDAQAHFETALEQAHELPHRIAQPEVRRWYASMLIDRSAAGDRDRARILLAEAIEMYRATGMPKHLEIAESMSAGLSP